MLAFFIACVGCCYSRPGELFVYLPQVNMQERTLQSCNHVSHYYRRLLRDMVPCRLQQAYDLGSISINKKDYVYTKRPTQTSRNGWCRSQKYSMPCGKPKSGCATRDLLGQPWAALNEARLILASNNLLPPQSFSSFRASFCMEI